MNELLFYFDVVCPYAYLASTQVERIAASHGAKLEWKPMLLGGVFRAIHSPDRPADSMPAARARMNLLDMRRWADHWGVPLSIPDGHPRRTVAAMRLCAAAGDALPTVAHALFRAYWVEGRDLADRAVLTELAAAHGIDSNAIDREEVKARLRAVTDEAIADGVFGAPSFVVVQGGARQLFWGQDRLDFVARALDGWAVPA